MSQIKAPKHPVARYLVASYLYYIHDISLIEDHEFDALAKHLLENPEIRASHPHGRLITEGDLQAGTLLLKPDQYPLIVRSVSKRYHPEIQVDWTIGYEYEEDNCARLEN